MTQNFVSGLMYLEVRISCPQKGHSHGTHHFPAQLPRFLSPARSLSGPAPPLFRHYGGYGKPFAREGPETPPPPRAGHSTALSRTLGTLPPSSPDPRRVRPPLLALRAPREPGALCALS